MGQDTPTYLDAVLKAVKLCKGVWVSRSLGVAGQALGVTMRSGPREFTAGELQLVVTRWCGSDSPPNRRWRSGNQPGRLETHVSIYSLCVGRVTWTRDAVVEGGGGKGGTDVAV